MSKIDNQGTFIEDMKQIVLLLIRKAKLGKQLRLWFVGREKRD
jgi:hypothetical protein